MNYTGMECPVCQTVFQDGDDVVVCPVCGTPHHRHCWQENGGCKNEEKHKDGFIWQMPQNAQPLNQPMPNTANGLKICPRCGEKNAPYEPVCTRCGERLKANRQTVADQMPDYDRQPFPGYGDDPNPHNFSPYQNVYAADARTVYGSDAQIDGIPATEVAEYVQKNSTQYVGTFLEMQEKKTKVKWNWSAGLFSVFWCLYRRMTAMGLAFLAILFSVNLLSSTAVLFVYKSANPAVYERYMEDTNDISAQMQDFMTNGQTYSTDSAVSLYSDYVQKIVLSPINITAVIINIAAVLIVNIILGFFGNYFYKKRIVKDINMLRQVAVDSMTYHMYIRQRGGVSYANVMIPILCYMALSLLQTYL